MMRKPREGEVRKAEMPRKVFRITEVLAAEFDELIVRPTGLSDGEIIRSLILQAIREQKRYVILKSGAQNNTR